VNKPSGVHTFIHQRLTKASATNYVIASIKLEGLDDGRLVMDGDPGKVLEAIATNLDAHRTVGDSVSEIISDGHKIGYDGDTVMGLVEYLRSLPEEVTTVCV